MYGARTAVKPAEGGLPSSVTVQCQGTAPRHLPQGEGYGGSWAAVGVARSALSRL